jgi:nucleotide-binding universal stress UspA family protein
VIRRILVPLDGSTVAESVLPYVEQFARLSDANLTLCQVIEPFAALVDFSGPEVAGLEPDVQVAEQEAEQYLSRIAERLRSDGLEAGARVALGSAADQLIQVGREFDLVAMATHGRSGIGRWVYGSVADKVLRGTTVPVLLVRAVEGAAGASEQPRHILVPLDGSELAEHALPLATDLARRAGAAITLLRSVNWALEVAGFNAYDVGHSSVGLIDMAEESARDYLSQRAQGLTAQGLTVHSAVRNEPAAESILDHAAEQQVDLIVMSTHGRGGMGRWVYGSVADRVLRGATVPVLLVRAGVTIEDATAPHS